MDPSENACVEYLRPKTVPDGLLAWGIVVQVSEIQVKLQITGGIVCLVDRSNISQSYANLIEEYNRAYGEPEAPPKLSQMFKRGQHYVCKIIEKQPRKGYAEAQDIIATLDPASIQEDQMPKVLLSIPQVPLQCAVKSVEDHGYQMDVGLKGLTGFLSFEDSKTYCDENNDGRKLSVGQVVRCYLKEALESDSMSRVIQLSMTDEVVTKSEFSQEKVSNHTLNERCILPGSKSFLTVMNVRRDGLLVNLMNEFSGFVSSHHLKDDWHTTKDNYKISDQIKCTVLYYNSITKTFALSLKTKSQRQKQLDYFLGNYYPGKVIKNAKVVCLDGTRSVTFKVDTNNKAIANVKDALDDDISTMTKDELHLTLDSTFPDGSKHKSRIKSLNLADLIVVLSLRQDFLNLPFVSVEELKPATFIDVTVKKYVKDGIIVNFGLNLRAIILNTDLHDYTSAKSYKKYPIGKNIKCRVLKVDTNKQPARVYLTNKEQLMDKQLLVVKSYDKSYKGKSTQATIVKISPNGLIVELFNNVKGFIPSRFLSSTSIKSISDLFRVGQVTSCVIYRVEPARQSLLLGIIPYEQIMTMKKENAERKKGDKEVKQLAKLDRNISKKVQVAASSAKKRLPDATDDNANLAPAIKSRRQRSEEAKLREEQIRETEKNLLDTDRQPQSIPDFERLVLKTPNSAEAWIKYSKFFLDNVETEKARIVCRRALRTISFRLEKEKMKIWLHLIKIEARFGGTEQLRAMIKEAVQTNDQLRLYQGAARVLSTCGELDEAERLHELLLKGNGRLVEVWIDYILFVMEHRKDADRARVLFDKACKILMKSDLVGLKSRFAQFEFKLGDVERGKTMFESLLNDNPKRTDLWRVYQDMVKKFGSRQNDSPEIQQSNEEILQRIAESIELVSKKGKKKEIQTANN